MKSLPVVLHLIDDTTAGGVMQVLDFLRSDPEMARTATHKVEKVKRGAILSRLAYADVVVSHQTVSWSLLPALLALRTRFARTPLIHVEHSYTDGFVAHNVLRKRRFLLLLELAYGLFDRVVAVSNGQADWMVANRLLRGEKLSTIQSCVALDSFRSLPVPQNPSRVFAAIGRLDRQKGFDTLIAAFRACSDPDIALHIIGEGAEETTLKQLAGDDTRIVFKGFQENTATALAPVDVVIMPSRWEAYGLVAIETLAAGRKLLCSNIDGLCDHAQLGAVLFDAKNTLALKELISQEARSGSAGRHGVSRQMTLGLEDRFRECWSYLLFEVEARSPGEIAIV
ncbi:glycosyltransferase [Sulfitobacter albidus]|uniref:Glycosyltransferase n=1 Tax=Sulfitobacter albidus TaxID=2829501 RepID=A0A975JDR6_9RHOB|nr:glycosyltransferase [Sulfitobacter albidus]QUJ76573.1 glycosyltransferase [Sulfitobacter albidus]